MSLRVGHLQHGVNTDSSPQQAPRKSLGLWNLLFSFKDHQRIVQIQMPTVEKRKETTMYLKGLLHDIRLLEGHLKRHQLHFDTLSILFREEAIKLDIKAINDEEEMSELVETYDHEGHFESIAGKPHLLLAHLCLHYVGFLSGGQALSPKYSKNFGEDAVHLYDFKDEEPRSLMNRLIVEVEEYLQGLLPEEFQAFKKEVQLGWTFTFDLFNANVRKAKCCCSSIQRIWALLFRIHV